jgi:hypothetical protein
VGARRMRVSGMAVGVAAAVAVVTTGMSNLVIRPNSPPAVGVAAAGQCDSVGADSRLDCVVDRELKRLLPPGATTQPIPNGWMFDYQPGTPAVSGNQAQAVSGHPGYRQLVECQGGKDNQPVLARQQPSLTGDQAVELATNAELLS